VRPRARLTPYVSLGVLVLGIGLGIGLGLSEAPTAQVAHPESAAPPDSRPPPLCLTPPTHGTVCPSLPQPGTPVSLPPGSIVIRHVPYPAVVIPATPCIPTDLAASITGMGPYIGMGTSEFIVTIRSTEPCQLEGYPVLVFSSPSAPVAADVQDGGIPGSYAPPGPVAVGTGAPASFLLFFAGNLNDTGTPATALSFGLPGTSPSIPVTLPSEVFALGSETAVTPFEQGNGVDQYA
jgi:Protein of unknown function (DUF4232)